MAPLHRPERESCCTTFAPYTTTLLLTTPPLPLCNVRSCIMPATCVSWLLMTACRDPGVLPRQEPDEEWLSGRKPRTKEVVVNGHPVQVGAPAGRPPGGPAAAAGVRAAAALGRGLQAAGTAGSSGWWPRVSSESGGSSRLYLRR